MNLMDHSESVPDGYIRVSLSTYVDVNAPRIKIAIAADNKGVTFPPQPIPLGQ